METAVNGLPAVSLVVPTRNRAYTLRLVAPGWYQQENVDEIVFVDDASDDETPALIASLAEAHPEVRTIVVRNPIRAGGPESRNRGAGRVTNEYVLFCDDDMYLEPGYAKTCLSKLLARNAGAVSGRLVYMNASETPAEALQRFGSGTRPVRMFRPVTCVLVHEAHSPGDVELPLTNPVMLTRVDLLKRFGFDSYYARGSGYREESDYQMNLFVNDYPIIVTNDCHSFHINIAQVRTGGARVTRWRKVYWAIFYTNYFFRKYWSRYTRRVGLRMPRYAAVAAFAVYFLYTTFLREEIRSFALGRATVRLAKARFLRRA